MLLTKAAPGAQIPSVYINGTLLCGQWLLNAWLINSSEHKASAGFPGYLVHRSAARNTEGWLCSEKTPTASQHLELLSPSAHNLEKQRPCPAQGSMEDQLCQLWAAWQRGWLPVSPNKVHTSWLAGIQGSLTAPVSSIYSEHIPDFFFPCNGFCQVTGNSLLTLFLENEQSHVECSFKVDIYREQKGERLTVITIRSQVVLLSHSVTQAKLISALTQAVPPLPHLWEPQQPLPRQIPGLCLPEVASWLRRSLLPKPGSKMPLEYLHKSLLFA